jgi:hypothetical protein
MKTSILLTSHINDEKPQFFERYIIGTSSSSVLNDLNAFDSFS